MIEYREDINRIKIDIADSSNWGYYRTYESTALKEAIKRGVKIENLRIGKYGVLEGTYGDMQKYKRCSKYISNGNNGEYLDRYIAVSHYKRAYGVIRIGSSSSKLDIIYEDKFNYLIDNDCIVNFVNGRVKFLLGEDESLASIEKVMSKQRAFMVDDAININYSINENNKMDIVVKDKDVVQVKENIEKVTIKGKVKKLVTFNGFSNIAVYNGGYIEEIILNTDRLPAFYRLNPTMFGMIKGTENIKVVNGGALRSSNLVGHKLNFSNLRAVGKVGFSYSTGYDIKIGEQLEIIDNCAFEGATLGNLIIDSNVRRIGDYAFSKSSLRAFRSRTEVYHMDSNAFDSAEELEVCDLGAGIYYLGIDLGLGITAFRDCKSLKKLILPAKFKGINIVGIRKECQVIYK